MGIAGFTTRYENFDYIGRFQFIFNYCKIIEAFVMDYISLRS